MSVQHIAMVLEADDLCAQEKAALVAFCNHTDATGKTFAGEERLMREAGMPRSTFRRWRAKLVERGLLISREKRNAKQQRMTSDTWVNLRMLAEMRDPWFNRPGRPADEEDQNPFDVVAGQAQVSLVGPGDASQVSPVVEPGLTGETGPGLTSETPNPQVTLTSSSRAEFEPIGSVAADQQQTDDDGELSKEQALDICGRVVEVRPEWQMPGIMAQLRQVAHLPYATVLAGFTEAARDRGLHTPMHLASRVQEVAAREESARSAAERRVREQEELHREIEEAKQRRATGEDRLRGIAAARDAYHAAKQAG